MEKEKKIPKHVGIIMDGNRRYAKRLFMQPWLGHEKGAKKVEALFDWCKEIGIKQVTLYTFSVENFGRPKDEVDFLMKIFKENFKRLLNDDKIMKEGIKVNFIGRISMFDLKIQDMIKKVMEKTKNNSNYTANFAMAYGGRHEITDTTKKIAQKVKDGKIRVEDINEELFRENLYLQDYPDIIIRTAGEKRTSDFLTWQGAYSELMFIDKTWPEFEKEDLIEVVEEYNRRERRFGK